MVGWCYILSVPPQIFVLLQFLLELAEGVFQGVYLAPQAVAQ